MNNQDINITTDSPSTIQNKRQFCTFWLSGRLFGVDILDVKEINKELNFTPIFHAPQQVKGYVNIRGQIHLIINLRILLGYKDKKTDSDSCMIIFKPTVSESFGVLVDKIGDVIKINEDRLEGTQAIAKQAGLSETKTNLHELIEAVCKLKDSLLLILNAKSFISALKVEDFK